MGVVLYAVSVIDLTLYVYWSCDDVVGMASS